MLARSQCKSSNTATEIMDHKPPRTQSDMKKYLNPLEPTKSPYHFDFFEAITLTDSSIHSAILVSRDGIRFRINAFVLRLSSELFQTVLSLPQPEGGAVKEPIIDNLDENAETIEGLLRMITGKGFPPLDTFESIYSMALAAHKWGMPVPLSVLKIILLRDTTFAQNQPIKLYSLALFLQWDEVKSLASRHSCNHDIFRSPASEPLLLSLGSRELFGLIKFHQQRRDAMDAYLAKYDWDPLPTCFQRTDIAISLQARLFRARFLEFMDSKPPATILTEPMIHSLIEGSELEGIQCRCSRFYGSARLITPVLISKWETLTQTV